MASATPSVQIQIPPANQSPSEAIQESSVTQSTLRGNASTPPRLKASTEATVVVDKTLSSVANLAKLLPTGTVLAFQALSASFTNRGACYPSNKYLTAVLLYLCVLSCVFFSFTDSLIGPDGKVYYGLATFKGFIVFNYNGDDEDRKTVFKDLSRLKIRSLDYVHAFFTVIVFLTVAFSSSAVQTCYFAVAGNNVKQLLTNLPVGTAFLSTMVFLIFPTTRKGIGYSDPAPSNH